MALFVKFKEISDKDLVDLLDASSTICEFYAKYFGNIGILIKEVYSVPVEYEGAKSLLQSVYREMRSRGLIDKN